MNIHAVSHSLPHRGPGASRARTRWQPYASNVSLSGIQRTPSSSHLHTPASSIAFSSSSTILLHPVCDLERVKPSQPPPPPPLVSALRDAQKTKYAAKLVDQAVKSLCATWHPDDIPPVYSAYGREALCVQPELPKPHIQSAPSFCLTTNGFATLFASRNTQLPSPVSPTSHQTPSPPGDRYESYSQAPDGSACCNLIPIKHFVHEVLRRSRTSTGVLQTALCYMEAVRSKIPDLLRAEKACPTSERLPAEASEPRIVSALSEDCDLMNADASDKTTGPTLQTIRIGDTVLVGDLDADMPQSTPATAHRDNNQSLPPLPPLPSPLCCPRRTFLACLILASKFLQDRSYSNRAWAKLAGLPPREIGRCERALGEALEWRLWVGKIPATSTNGGRSLLRARSDGDILCGAPRTCSPPSTAAWAASPTAGAVTPASSLLHNLPILPPPVPAPTHRTRCLQRSATVPAIVSDRSEALAHPAQFEGFGYWYDARSAPGTGYDTTFAMDVEPRVEVSPSLSTPTLCDSPMSSASSSSDGSEGRTIQMSMFMDLPTPSLSSLPGCNRTGGPWVANTSTYVTVDPAKPRGSFGPFATYNPYCNITNTLDVDIGDATEGTIATGPTLSAINPNASKRVFTSLPSFSEAFPDPYIGVYGTGMQ